MAKQQTFSEFSIENILGSDYSSEKEIPDLEFNNDWCTSSWLLPRQETIPKPVITTLFII